jgi:uncharacterized protein (DUF2062 family)
LAIFVPFADLHLLLQTSPGGLVIDEAHIVTTNPLLSPYMTKVVNMWHKLGAWLCLATQNLADCPDTSEKILNMAEWQESWHHSLRALIFASLFIASWELKAYTQFETPKPDMVKIDERFK